MNDSSTPDYAVAAELKNCAAVPGTVKGDGYCSLSGLIRGKAVDIKKKTNHV